MALFAIAALTVWVAFLTDIIDFSEISKGLITPEEKFWLALWVPSTAAFVLISLSLGFNSDQWTKRLAEINEKWRIKLANVRQKLEKSELQTANLADSLRDACRNLRYTILAGKTRYNQM